MNQIETFKANRRDKQSNIIRETCSQLTEQVCYAKILFGLDFSDNNDLFILRNIVQLSILELQNNFRCDINHGHPRLQNKHVFQTYRHVQICITVCSGLTLLKPVYFLNILNKAAMRQIQIRPAAFTISTSGEQAVWLFRSLVNAQATQFSTVKVAVSFLILTTLLRH